MSGDAFENHCIVVIPFVAILYLIVIAIINILQQEKNKMSATTATKFNFKKINLREFSAVVLQKFSESLGDMIITVAVTGVTLFYMFHIIPSVYANTLPGLYVLGMLTQLFIRIVHRFDDSYTTDELADSMIDFEASVIERLDEIKRNV